MGGYFAGSGLVGCKPRIVNHEGPPTSALGLPAMSIWMDLYGPIATYGRGRDILQVGAPTFPNRLNVRVIEILVSWWASYDRVCSSDLGLRNVDKRTQGGL